MSEDWCTAIQRVESAVDDLKEALEDLAELAREVQGLRKAGLREVHITRGLVARGAKETRLGPTGAFRRLEAALTDYRALTIRALVDEDHMTFTEVGELIGVTRQMVARLYRRAGDHGPATEGRDEN